MVDERHLVAEERQRRERRDAVPLSQFRLFGGDEVDAVFISFVVDFLQAVEDRVARVTVFAFTT